MISIRRRLLLLLLIGMGLGVLVTGILVYHQTDDEVSELYDAHLEQIATLLAQQLGGSAPAPLPARPLITPRQLKRWDEQNYLIQLWTLQGELIESFPGRLDAQHQIALQPAKGFHEIKSGNVDWHLYRANGDRLTIQVAQMQRPRLATIRGIGGMLLWPLILQVPLFLSVAWISVRLGLLPLDELSLALEQRQPESLQPLSEKKLPVELLPLVRSLNGLLRRLDAALQQQRHFVGDAAHELRTPISALRLQLDALHRADSPQERHEAMVALESGVARASKLTQQLLLIARAESPVNSRTVTELSLEQVGKEALERHLSIAQANNIDLGIDRLDQATLRAASEDISVVLDNLLSNAINYSGAGSRVDLSLYLEGDNVVIEVTDDGPGIPAHEREPIFNRFHRVLGNTVEGTGLGLAIVKTICDRYRARIDVSDGPTGKGTRFRIEWPGN